MCPDDEPFGPAPKMLTAADIRNAADLATKVVGVPEWGGAVTLHGLSYDAYQAAVQGDAASMGEADQVTAAKRLLCAMCAELSLEDAEWLGEKNPAVLARLLGEAKSLMPVGPAEVAAAEATFLPAAASAE